MIGNGPLPRGLKTVASRGLSPCRRYSTSATSMSYVVFVPMAISRSPFSGGRRDLHEPGRDRYLLRLAPFPTAASTTRALERRARRAHDRSPRGPEGRPRLSAC